MACQKVMCTLARAGLLRARQSTRANNTNLVERMSIHSFYLLIFSTPLKEANLPLFTSLSLQPCTGNTLDKLRLKQQEKDQNRRHGKGGGSHEVVTLGPHVADEIGEAHGDGAHPERVGHDPDPQEGGPAADELKEHHRGQSRLRKR